MVASLSPKFHGKEALLNTPSSFNIFKWPTMADYISNIHMFKEPTVVICILSVHKLKGPAMVIKCRQLGIHFLSPKVTFVAR